MDAWVKEVWPTALKLFIPRFVEGDFAEVATPAAREAYRLREEQAFGNLDELRKSTPTLLGQIDPMLTALVPLLENRKAIGTNDITLWPVLRSLSIVRAVTFPETVRSYMDRISQKCGVPLLFEQSR